MSALEIFINMPDEADAGQLATYLEEACRGDTELRAEVEELIAKDSHESGFMGAPALGSGAIHSAAMAEQEGTVVDDYKLIQEIGKGGFGVVYLADQLAPVKRRVALKVIKLGMDTRQVVARFEAERQALAMMDHPGIAKVYDAGATESGRPYFVMELVRGLSITEFCEEQHFGVRERLDLFIDVCSAVQHAHQKGIIHRDLKPSNIMVTIQDDKAVPKVIDFGVAKATQQDLTDKTLFTRVEQFIGTPAYMSPEQCQPGGLDIDTRSDIYSLGVLLYELLTGSTPIEVDLLTKASHEEIRRVIREKEPKTPSTRQTELRRRTSGGDADRAFLVSGEIDRELDWIVMKALEKDRKRRYDTAGSLAADVRRHLKCEPVEAGPPGVAYRIGKVVRRHRAAVLTSAAMLALLISGVAVSSWQWLRASQSEAEVVVERDRARENEERALWEKRVARHQVVEGLFSEKKTHLAIAHLARMIREDPGNRVAGERLMSALRTHPIPQRNSPALARTFSRKNISGNGNYLVSAVGGKSPGHRVSRTDGALSRYPLIPALEGYEAQNQVAFNPIDDSQLIVAYRDTSNGFRGAARIWDLEEDAQVGEVVEFDNSVGDVGFSPDGSLVFAASYSRSLRVWSPDGAVDWEGRVEWMMQDVTFSPDSRLIAVGTKAGTVTLWDSATGKVIVPPLVHGSPVWAMAFDPKSERLITGCANGVAEIWDVRSGQSTGVRIGHSSAIRAIEFSPNGRAVLTATLAGEVQVWDADSGDSIGGTMALMEFGGMLKSARFDRVGSRIVAATHQKFKIWSVSSSEPIGGLPLCQNLRDVFFEGDGNQLFACDVPSQRWEAPGDRPLSRILRHSKTGNNIGIVIVSSATFDHDGKSLITSGGDGKVRLWDVASARELMSFQVINIVRSAAWRPDEKVVVGAFESGASLWDLATGKKIKDLRHGHTPQAVFAPVRDERGRWRVATISTGKDAAIQIWNGQNGEQIGPDLPLAPGIGSVTMKGVPELLQFSRDGERIAAFDGKDTVLLWDISGKPETWQLLRKFSQDGDYWGMHWSSDERRIVMYGLDGLHRQWDVETGEIFKPVVAHSQGIMSARFDPSGERIVTASADQTARIWDAETLTSIGVPLRHDGVIGFARFSSDGNRIVTTSLDGTARIWDATTGFPLSEPLRHELGLYYAEFSPDGRQVVTTSLDSTARVWDVPPAPEGSVPDWVAGWAEALVGLRILEDGTSVNVSWEETRTLEALALQANQDSFYGRTVEWYYENPDTRSISPFCLYSVDNYVADRLNETDLNGLGLEGSLEEVLRIDPQHTGAMSKLAEFLVRVDRAEKVLDLRRARYLSSLAVSLEPGNSHYAAVAERVEKELKKRKDLKEASTLEARANENFEEGNPEIGRSFMDFATMARLRIAINEGWPGRSERHDVMAKWLEVQPREMLVGKGSLWKFMDQFEGAMSDDWKEPGYSDENWKEGRAPLGFSKNGEDGEVTRLEQGPEGSERVTFYFRHRFLHSSGGDESSRKSLFMNIRRDDGAVVYLNGQEILRSNMPAGKIDEGTLASQVVGRYTENRYWLSLVDSDFLREGANVLAVEVHQIKPSSSDVIFDLELELGEHPADDLGPMIELGKDDFEGRAIMCWMLGDEAQALEAIDQLLASIATSFDPADILRRKDWLRRKAIVLRSLNRGAQAEAVLHQVTAVPPRNPDIDPKLIDLSEYTESFFQEVEPMEQGHFYWFERLAESFVPVDGPGFDIRGKIQLNSGIFQLGESVLTGKDYNSHNDFNYPGEVRLTIDQKGEAVHFLQSCNFGHESVGEEIAHYLIHFEDGEPVRVPVIYGRDIIDVWIHDRSTEELAGIENFAWKQQFTFGGSTFGTLGLTQQTWENPHPDKTITHIDFVSNRKMAAPFLVGVTVE